MEKDADSMVVKPVEYAASEYSASSEAPPVSIFFHWNEFCNDTKVKRKKKNNQKLHETWKCN